MSTPHSDRPPLNPPLTICPFLLTALPRLIKHATKSVTMKNGVFRLSAHPERREELCVVFHAIFSIAIIVQPSYLRVPVSLPHSSRPHPLTHDREKARMKALLEAAKASRTSNSLWQAMPSQ